MWLASNSYSVLYRFTSLSDLYMEMSIAYKPDVVHVESSDDEADMYDEAQVRSECQQSVVEICAET